MKKKFDNSEVITFKCNCSQAKHLRKIAMSFTRQEGRLYTLSDLIRDTLRQVFPEPKQLDFIEENKKTKMTK